MAKQYRSLENQGTESRKDDILRAAVCAFVALTHPSRRDCNQIEDLALSILPYTNEATKRYVSAALSNSVHAPNALIRELCAQAPQICAPLLLSSPVLSALDMAWIVGTKSREHARIISKRPHLPNIVIEALALLDDPVAQARVSYGNVSKVGELTPTPHTNLKPISADHARDQLRDIMVATFAEDTNVLSSLPASEKSFANASNNHLVNLALHEQTGIFVTALADLSGLPFDKALKLIRRPSPSELSALLKSFDIKANDAFVICSVFYPIIAASRAEIRLFMDRHNALEIELCRDMVRTWKAAEISLAIKKSPSNSGTSSTQVPLTSDGLVDWEKLVKAS